MSSRLIALKYPTELMIASISYFPVFRGYMQNGTTSTSPNNLKSKLLPSMTGNPALGPMFPRPRIDVPSVTIVHNCLVLHGISYCLTSYLKCASVNKSFNGVMSWKFN